MKLSVMIPADTCQCDECQSQRIVGSGSEYMRADLEMPTGRTFRRRIKVEAEVLRLEKILLDDGQVKVNAVLEMPCLRCKKATLKLEQIAALDTNAIFRALRCQICNSSLDVVSSELLLEKVSEAADTIAVIALLQCRNPSCRAKDFAARLVRKRYKELLNTLEKAESTIDLEEGLADSGAAGLQLREVLTQESDDEAGRTLRRIVDQLGALDQAEVQKELTLISSALSGGVSTLPPEKKEKLAEHARDFVVQGVGGGLGQVFGNLILTTLGLPPM